MPRQTINRLAQNDLASPFLMNTRRFLAVIAGTVLAICCLATAAQAQIVLPGTNKAPLDSTVPGDENAPPKLSIAQELGLGGLNFGSGGKHIELFGSFTAQKGSRRGVLSIAATIDPGWHTYSVTQLPGATSPTRFMIKDTADYKLLGKFQADREPHIKRVEFYRVPSRRTLRLGHVVRADRIWPGRRYRKARDSHQVRGAGLRRVDTGGYDRSLHSAF